MQRRDQYDLIYKILVITIYIIYIIIKYFREESRIINVNEETGDGRRAGQGAGQGLLIFEFNVTNIT